MASFAYEPSLAELIALSHSVELKLNQVSLSDSSNFTDPETELIKVSLFLMIGEHQKVWGKLSQAAI